MRTKLSELSVNCSLHLWHGEGIFLRQRNTSFIASAAFPIQAFGGHEGGYGLLFHFQKYFLKGPQDIFKLFRLPFGKNPKIFEEFISRKSEII